MSDTARPTDDPQTVLLALRIVDAVRQNHPDALRAALSDTMRSGRSATVMLSLAALAAELVRALPDADERMATWLLATDLEIPAVDATPAD